MKVKYIITVLFFAKLCSSLLQPTVIPEQDIYFESECVCKSGTEEDLKNTITKTNDDIEKIRVKDMVPGVVAGISIKGKTVWTQAFGQTDIENNVTTHTDSVWRMGSISKALTTGLIAKLIDKGLIDLEKSIHQYLSPKVFPLKQWNGKNVTITVKQVMSHTAGIRISKFPDDFLTINDYKNVTQTLNRFKDEPLIHSPGTAFNYSNDGFQILGAIIESVMNETYESAINTMFKELGMGSTSAESHEKIIPHRAHYYMLSNSPYIENYKNVTKIEVFNAQILDDLVSLEALWPCGGLVSTVSDLLKFGNYMLNSYKRNTDQKSEYIKSSTVKKIWTPILQQTYQEVAALNTTHYAEGWFITNFSNPLTCSGSCKTPPIKQMMWHPGGISGVTTILAIFPEQDYIIVVLTNLGSYNEILNMLLKIATNFATL